MNSIMDANRLTHIYGLSSLVVGAVGIFVGFKVGADWKEIALFASGWITALVISFHLNSSMKFHGESSDKVIEANNLIREVQADRVRLENELSSLRKDFSHEKKSMAQEIERLNELLKQRTMTLDFVASVKMQNSAIARKNDEAKKVDV